MVAARGMLIPGRFTEHDVTNPEKMAVNGQHTKRNILFGGIFRLFFRRYRISLMSTVIK